MPHQDTTCPTASAPHHQDLKVVLDALLQHADLSTIHFRTLCTWTPLSLIVAALLWAWSDEPTLTTRFATARKIAIRTLGLNGLTATTYQARVYASSTLFAASTLARYSLFQPQRSRLVLRLSLDDVSCFNRLMASRRSKARFSPLCPA
jgi:hypothetical protein